MRKPLPLPFAFILALISGTLMPYAFAPYNFVFLALIGLASWLQLILLHPQHSFKLGWLFGFGWFGFGSWWLADTFQTYGHIPYIVGLIAIAILGLIVGLFFALWAWVISKLLQNKTDILWLFPVVGVLEEWLRSFIFTGLPWTALGNLVLETPLSSWVSICGSYGVVLILLFIVASFVLLLQPQKRKFGSLCLIIASLFVIFPPHIEVPQQPSHQAALIQPNIPQNQKWDAIFIESIMLKLVGLSQQANKADLIVWPEAAVPVFLSQTPAWNTWLKKHMDSWHTPVIFGGLQPIKATNKLQSGLFLSQNGAEHYDFVGKHHLVPFGEYVPSWIPWVSKLVPDIGDFEPATDTGILTIGDQNFGSIICYESIFPEEARSRVSLGANVLIVVTNDAWYGQSPAAWQHLQASQMRAIETGRYALRATNTGITAIIAPDGNIQASIPWWQEGVLQGRYQPLTHTTTYQQWGDTPLLWVIFSSLAFGLFRFYRGKQ